MTQHNHRPTRYWGLALLRLLLLFVLSCFLVVATALLIRAEQDQGWDLAEPRPALAPQEVQLPFLGITTALEQATASAQRLALQRLRQQGFGWIRQRLDWGLLEPTPGHYVWHTSDTLIQEIVAAGLIPVIVLDGSPAWARAAEDRTPTANALAPPADPVTFARFVAAFATRYHDNLRYYQLWDEPNIAPHWGNRMIEPVAYAQLLKAVVPALRAADPDAVIITAALAPTGDRGHLAIDEVYFLQRLYATGAAPFFDIVAAQPFGFGYAPDDERARVEVLNFQRVKLLRRAMLAAGDGYKPIWAVRYGWNTNTNSPWRTVRPSDQVAFATAALTIARQQWPWLTAMGWAIDQPAAPPTAPSWGFALTPALADAFQRWQTSQASTIAVPLPPGLDYWCWGGLLLLWLVVGWRATAALHILPWSHWQQSYARWPQLAQVSLWLLLFLLYYFTTWSPLIVLCWLLLTLLMLPKPLAGLSVVAIFLPFYFQHKEILLLNDPLKIPPAHAALLCLWLALSCSVRQQLLGRWVKQFHLVDWLALLWVVISLCTSSNVWHWPAYGQGLVDLVLLPGLAYLATRLVANTPRRQQQICQALFGGGVVAALLGLLLWGLGEGTAADGVLRLVGPYFSPNHTALYLERAWWVGLGLALAWHGKQRYWSWLALTIIGLALWLTASRGAWVLGMPAGALVFGWSTGLLKRQQRLRFQQLTKPIAMVGFGGVVGLLLLVGVARYSPLSAPLWQRLTNSATIAERLTIWQATLQMWQDHWLLGVGPGGFFWHYPSYLAWSLKADPNLLHPHNLWLEMLTGWGIVGLLWGLLVSWQVWQMVRTCQNLRDFSPAWLASGLLAALAAGVAHGQVDTFSALPDLAVWNWLVLGLLVTLSAKRHGEQTQVSDKKVEEGPE